MPLDAATDSFRRAWEASDVRDTTPGDHRLLIVDDFEDGRYLYVQYFIALGFIVEEATDGAEALEKIQATRPDVVVMDLAMPHMDGLATTRALRDDPSTATMPIVIVTGHANTADAKRAKEAGANEVCAKPCAPNDLSLLVLKHLRPKPRDA